MTQVGGLISLNFDSVEATSSIALSFTESPSFIRPTASDDSSFPDESTTYDTVLNVPAPLPTGLWTQPAFSLRGGFRFLTIVSTASQPITISNVSCSISFMPHVDDLRAYTGYFSAADPDFHDPNFLTKSMPSTSIFNRPHSPFLRSMDGGGVHGANQYGGAEYRTYGSIRARRP
jgi:hypothetical protein